MKLNPFSRLSFRRLVLSLILGTILPLILIATTGAAPQAPQESETIVRCNPAFNQVVPGEQFSIDIYIQDVQNLSGADIQLSYDPMVLQAVDQNPTSSGIQMELLDVFLHPDFVLRNYIDPAEKKIWYAAVQINSPINPRDPANGSGPLASVVFKALKAGEFDLPVTYAKLSTPNGVEIPYTLGSCIVRVLDDTPSPRTIRLPVVVAP